MRILITGASGFVGSLLSAALLEDGHELIAAARDTGRIQRAVELELRRRQPNPPRLAGQLDLARVDVLSGDGLAQALEGVDVAYYLIHSMERGAHAPFAGAGVPYPSDLTELTELVASGQLAALLGGSRTGSS